MKTKATLLVSPCLLSFLLLNSSLSYGVEEKEGAVTVGVTFSQVQCEYMGLSWKDTYRRLLKEKFDIIRLGAYWDRIEKMENVYDFNELDWQIREAEKKKQKILLVVGMKAPRWPEFHIPGWALKEVKVRDGGNVANSLFLKQKTLQFIKLVVNRYKEFDTIVAWQAENEPLNRSGWNNWWIGREFLEQEIKWIESFDKRPVVVNVATYGNGLLRFFSRLMYIKNPIFQVIDIARIPALNIYPGIGHKVLNLEVCFFSNTGTYTKYFNSILNYARRKKKDLWVTELQAEPWEPGKLVHLDEPQAVTCWPQSYIITFNDLRRLGLNTVFLWGVEYWYYREKFFKDASWLQAAKGLMEGPDSYN